MSIPAIGPVGFTPFVAPTLPTSSIGGVDAAAQTAAASGGSGADFGQLLSQGLQNHQGLHSQADSLADLQIELVHGTRAVRIDLGQLLELDRGHSATTILLLV